MDDPHILLTNDDGIHATGFHALYEALSSSGTVTAVAPAEDQSAVGRALSGSVSVREHELGYVINGTPGDCVVAGLTTLVPDADIVVAGCNHGANLGAAVLGRSGTVSAAVEAAFFDAPAIAVSMYVPADSFEDVDKRTVSESAYDEAVRATSYLVDRPFGMGIFEAADYLNVNAPMADGNRAPMAITRPSHVYRMDAELGAGTIELTDNIWELMASGDCPDPDGTDRRAVMEGKVSVSPLTAPHTVEAHESLDSLADSYLQDE